MSQAIWNAVDKYFTEALVKSDKALKETLKKSKEAGLPPIHVAPNQGKLLQLLALAVNAKRVLEVGTLGGYSTIWLARGMQKNGKLITLEYDPDFAKIAKANIKYAKLSNTVEIRIGLALDSLKKMQRENIKPFDLIFIDADKSNNSNYFKYALKFSRPGTMIIVDNVVRDGEVIDSKTTDSTIRGIRKFIELLSKSPHVDATAIQTVGIKGYDGFSLVIVK